MRKSKRARLEAAGWAVGSVKEFLGLSEADAALIEMKLALSRSLRPSGAARPVSDGTRQAPSVQPIPSG